MITSLIVFIILTTILFKLTGFLFKVAGKLIGAIFSFIGWFILGVLAICATGLAVIIVPVIVIAFVVSISSAAALV